MVRAYVLLAPVDSLTAPVAFCFLYCLTTPQLSKTYLPTGSTELLRKGTGSYLQHLLFFFFLVSINCESCQCSPQYHYSSSPCPPVSFAEVSLESQLTEG